MKKFAEWTLNIFGIISSNCLVAQIVSDGLTFFKEDTFSVFYEGRRDLSFDFVLENTTSHKLKVESAFNLVSLLEIRDSTNNVIYRTSKDAENEYSQFVYFQEHKLEWPHTYFKPKEKICARQSVSADLTPNFVLLNTYLNKTTEKKLPQKYISWRSGTYKLTFIKQCWPSKDTLYTSFNIHIKPATGPILSELKEYVKAVAYYQRTDSLNNIISDSLPTLWRFVLKNPKSGYIEDIVNMFFYKGIKPSGDRASNFQSDTLMVFKMIELMPNLKSISTNSRILISSNIHHYLSAFISRGYIKDRYVYFDQYLKRLEHFHPTISQELIRNLDLSQQMRGFRNYAQERVDNETSHK